MGRDPGRGALTSRSQRVTVRPLELLTAIREKPMKPSTKDEVAGKIHEVKGAVKEKVGKLTNNPDLEAEGTVEKVVGKVQKKIGQVKKVFGT
jgi:uncharacterized protein YjbJ (UPF0337 family)